MSEKQTKPEANIDQLYKEIEENARQEKHNMTAMAEDTKRAANKEKNELLRFFGGMLLFAAGLFMIFQNVTVDSSWGYGAIFRIGGYSIPNGTIMIPLLLGIALLFLLDRKLWGWLFIAIGIVIILAAIILSVHMRWRTSSLWVFFVMFALTIAGGAMMLRELFRSK